MPNSDVNSAFLNVELAKRSISLYLSCKIELAASGV